MAGEEVDSVALVYLGIGDYPDRSNRLWSLHISRHTANLDR